MVTGLPIYLALCLVTSKVLATDYNAILPLEVHNRRCFGQEMLLNDCNWCRCKHTRFYCATRPCHKVDMFGHFKDAIADITVGMEGHGVWRSGQRACEPGMQYQRKGLLCVCDKLGNWPNPVCRDIFRVLHSVELAKVNQNLESLDCEPFKLYLVGCNTCFCSKNGYLDSNLCTKETCPSNDPVLEDPNLITREDDDSEVHEVYAECQTNLQYKLGCQKCKCLRNNRLLCNNCTSDTPRSLESICDTAKPGQVFNKDCNHCYCDTNKNVICSTKKCLSGTLKEDLKKTFNSLPETHAISVATVHDYHDCIIGTKFKFDCNDCYCYETSEGSKAIACTKRKCNLKDAGVTILKKDCVKNTVYSKNCLHCRCGLVKGMKWELCKLDPQCAARQSSTTTDVDSLNGFCEPHRIYKKDCNTCRCISNGDILRCTTNDCTKELENNNGINTNEVEIIPVRTKYRGTCPKGHSYKIDCNYCFCLDNGNALCSTADCEDLNIE